MENKFKRRVTYYLFGLVLGLVLVFLFTDMRGCASFLPENKVKENINARYIYSGLGPACQLKCNDVSPADLTEFVDKADVNFSKSDTREDFKEYHLTGKIEDKKVVMRFGYREVIKGTTTYDSTGKLLNIEGLDGTCDCRLEKGPYWVNPDAVKLHKLLQGGGVKRSLKAQCQMECLGLDKAALQDVFEARQIDWKSSSTLADEARLVMLHEDLRVVIQLTEDGLPLIESVAGSVKCPECDQN